MQTNPPLSRIKTLSGPRVRGISPIGKEKVYGGNNLPKSQVLSSEWKTERVREDASGHREGGKEDEARRWWWTAMCDRWKWRRLCLTRLTKIDGEFVQTRCSILKRAISDFQRRLGIGRRARVTIDEERVVTRLNRNQVVEIQGGPKNGPFLKRMTSVYDEV